MSIFELQFGLKLIQLSKYAVLIFCFSIIIPFSRFIKCFVNLQNSTVARVKIKYYLPLYSNENSFIKRNNQERV